MTDEAECNKGGTMVLWVAKCLDRGGGGGEALFFFPEKKLCQTYHNGLGVLLSLTYITDL